MDELLARTHHAEREHFWFKGFRQFIGPLIDEVLEGRPDARVLDCGCGTGNNLSALRARSDAFGFDLTMSGLRLARQHDGLRVARASITHIPFASNSFDLATSFDVLQCLTEAQETLALGGMARVLRPGGHLLLNLAALELLRGSHSVLAEEVRRYTRPMIRRALDRAGLVPVRVTYTNFSLFPVMLVTRTWQRWRGLANGHSVISDILVPSPPVNQAFAALLSLEARALRLTNMPVGSSILVLARKPHK